MQGCKAITSAGRLRGLRLSGFVLLAAIALAGGNEALAQDAAASCAPAIGRVVSLQGNVEVQRAGSPGWLKVSRLDTSICAGDRLRTDALSRAALFVQPETLVRVDKSTTISISQTTSEVLVEFHIDQVSRSAQDLQSCGAGYFITRFPKKFKVSTPHMNAAVEGTEFMVESSCRESALTVLEGRVVSQLAATQETRSLTAGQRIESGPTSGSAFSTVIRPADAVQWALHYLPLSDARTEAEIPTETECRELAESLRTTCLTERAEMMLRLGRVDQALQGIEQALALDSSDSDANSLRAIIQIAKNDKVAGMESARKAVAADSSNSRGWLAMSYALQASFELEQALESAIKAKELRADSALIHARVAELLLSLGHRREAEESARAAVTANPGESSAHMMLGFVYLAQVNTTAARAAFEFAIDRDSFSALPRLGLGLAMIRDGRLIAGREQLEIAVALDPFNSLLRSYVGKAYFAENTPERDSLAETQWKLGKEFDRNDPTPWLYEAIALQSTNRPNAAIASLQKSIELNDNRAVYRSRQLLAEDNAVRGISLARAYRENGFDQLAVRESAVSISSDPANFASHRFLADSYLSLPRHEVARQSELLQSQLLQPLTASPIQPQLTEDNFFILSGAGPATVGISEFTPLFTQDGLTIQADIVAGDLDTWGDQVILSGINDRLGFAISHLGYSTSGFRSNDDFEKQVFDGFMQVQATPETGFQVELRHSDTEFGDPLLSFDPELFFDDVVNQRESRARLGIRHRLAPGSELIASAIAVDEYQTIEFSGVRAITNDTKSIIGEIQHLLAMDRFSLLTGVGYDSEEQRQEFFDVPFTFKPYAANAYAYANFLPFSTPFTAHLGVSVDYLADRDDFLPSTTQVNPKIGITTLPWQGATLRVAAVRALRRQFVTRQTLEPTQVAGFNQFYDDLNATDSRRYALAFDQSVTDGVFAGFELSRRDLTVPFDQTGEQYEWDERNGRAYVYWAPNDSVALTAAYSMEEFTRPLDFPGRELITHVQTRTLPLGVTLHLRGMFFARFTGTYANQSGRFFSSSGDPTPVPGEDAFWLVDLSFGYRLPKRMGSLSLDVRNAFDENFQFQETDLFNRKFARERVLLFRGSFAF